MKNKPDSAHPADADLFQQALEGVTPLKPSNRKPPSPAARKTPRPGQEETIPAPDTLSDHGAGDVALTEHLASGLNRLTLRDLRRGRWKTEDELDLHGLSSDAARRLLAEFLHRATRRGLKCVHIIHGKGWRSEGREGILKVHTRHWLAQHQSVLAFCEAPQGAGGSGAVRVLLRTQRTVQES